ncbi:TNT domain-containing protein [Actinomadura flavalba]|uniref:TNT domain-containing protein n=1 Tax=Actinomadura flavalba TaxID=1120938 RepID=UPI00037A3D45|nr:TNT domain-containing protein [Actinomadura flavalba]
MSRLRAVVSALVLSVGFLVVPAPASAAPPPRAAERPGTCTGEFRGDARLGPKRLPNRKERPVGPLLEGWKRTGNLAPAAFFARYWRAETPQSPAGWKYPPNDGFATVRDRLDKNRVTLRPGLTLDRFGSEYGSFLAPAGDAYAKRSLPPQNLNTREQAYPCDYHRYRVRKAFPVWQGRIAPWFAQPGGGRQIMLDPALLSPGPDQRLNVGWLVANGYLARA